MPSTQTQPDPHATRWLLIQVGLVVILLLAAAIIALRVEPVRAAIWQSAGPSCGLVALLPSPNSGLNRIVASDNTAAETCFARSFARCQAASLTVYERTGLDSTFNQTFVVEPAVLGPCGLADQ
jgi:hypothetical protein